MLTELTGNCHAGLVIDINWLSGSAVPGPLPISRLLQGGWPNGRNGHMFRRCLSVEGQMKTLSGAGLQTSGPRGLNLYRRDPFRLGRRSSEGFSQERRARIGFAGQCFTGSEYST